MSDRLLNPTQSTNPAGIQAGWAIFGCAVRDLTDDPLVSVTHRFPLVVLP